MSSNESTNIRRSEQYLQFRANVPLTKTSISNTVWSYYELGPRDVPPLIFIPGTSTNADCYFYQLMLLGNKGYRVLSVHFPPSFTVNEWVESFDSFRRSISIEKFHFFGSSLGGYLAFHYFSAFPQHVLSIITSNSFIDTKPFHSSNNWIKLISFFPEFYLKKFILDSLPDESRFPQSIDFVVESLEEMNRKEIASRLSLNLSESQQPKFRGNIPITFIDTDDDISLPEEMRSRLYEAFPKARQALLKEGGDWPFLTVPDQVNLHIEIHLRSFLNSVANTTDNDTKSITDENILNNNNETELPKSEIVTKEASVADRVTKTDKGSSITVNSSSPMVSTSNSSIFLKPTDVTVVAHKLAQFDNEQKKIRQPSAIPSVNETKIGKNQFVVEADADRFDNPSNTSLTARKATEDRIIDEENKARAALTEQALKETKLKQEQENEMKAIKLKESRSKQQALIDSLVDTEARPQISDGLTKQKQDDIF